VVAGLVGYQEAQAAPPASAVASVAIKGFAFSPSTLTVAPGTTVKWTNMDSAAHTVTSKSGAWADSGTLSTGTSFSHVFTHSGTFAYYCAIHPYMTATIVVTGGGSGASSTGSGNSASATSSTNTGSGMAMMGSSSKLTMKAWTGFFDVDAVTYVTTDTSSKLEASPEHINYSASLGKAVAYASLMYFSSH
jgi:plastocyanin